MRVGAADAERADAGAPRRPAPRPRRAARVARRTGCRRSRSAGSGVSKCRLGGIARCSSASTVLIRPATPAAASRWPMLVLTEPEGAEAAARRCRARNAWVSAATSIGSPSARAGAVRLDVADRVRGRRPPTPCATRDHRRLAVDARRGEADLGRAVVVDAVPRITAWMGSPSRSASSQALEHHHAGAAARRRCRRRRRRRRGSGRPARAMPRSGTGSPRCAAAGSTTPPASAMSHSPAEQALARQVDRHQRGRAGRLHGHGRPAQVELVGDARASGSPCRCRSATGSAPTSASMPGFAARL